MALWSPGDLLGATGGFLTAPFAATGVSIDSRTVQPGALFIALVTETGDGHAHAADALARGAAGAMVHRLPEGVGDDAPLLQVADTMEGLRALARFARARFKGRVVAVTGSVGKTTTKEMLRVALGAHGRAWAAEASHNNHWGVPLTLARTPAGHDFCVVEIGMNHPGEIAPLSRMARPDVALVTAVAATHIGNMGSLEAIAREKVSIAEGLPGVSGAAPRPGPLPEGEGAVLLPLPWGEGRGEGGGVGKFVLPSDGPALAAWGKPALTFGAEDSDFAQLLATASDAEHNRVVARVAGQEVAFILAAPGAHMADNAVAALAAVAALGLDPAPSAAALDGFAPVAGRGARRALPDGALLLDESYNASAASVRAALAVLGLQTAARKLAVLGDMLELGEHGPAEHVGLAPDVERNAQVLFTCGPLMRLLHEAVPPALRGAHAADAAALAPIVADAVRADDAVLVKGSLGSRMRLVVQALEAG